MRALSKITVLGIVLVILSPLVGIAGTVWSIYGSFDALAKSEGAGIGSVGAQIQLAIVFSIAGILGTIIGVLIIIIGMRRARKP